MPSNKTPSLTRCENCGHPEGEHWALNYADGPMVSGTVLVCPTAVFRLQRGPNPKRRRDAK